MSENGFIFYKSFYDALNEVTDPMEKLAAIEAILKYGIEHKETKLNGIAKIIYTMAKPQIDANTKRKVNGSKGGRPVEATTKETVGFESEKPLVNANEKPLVSESENQGYENEKPKEKEKVKEKEKDKDKDKEKEKDKEKPKVEEKEKKEKTGFVPPTVAEVQDYCRERQNNVDAEAFVAFYASKGWMVGSNKMTNWKQAVHTWEKRQKEREVARSGTPSIWDAWDNA